MPLNPNGPLTADASGSLYFSEGNRVRKTSAGTYVTIGNTSNIAGYSGDNGPAVTAQFNYPQGVAVAANGDIYVADNFNQRVRLINGKTGIVTTIAGSSGDGGIATSATLTYPVALALDGAGNLFVGELYGYRIRKITLGNYIISTVAGNGTQSFADGVAATTTGIALSYSIFADQSSNLFIADYSHFRVRKVDVTSGLILTVAGNGVFSFAGDGAQATAAQVCPW